jgi:hypothetical protein
VPVGKLACCGAFVGLAFARGIEVASDRPRSELSPWKRNVSPASEVKIMSEFSIKIARIERTTDHEAAPEVCLTFRIEREDIDFYIPVRLNVIDYDDTEMVQVARGVLNRLFSDLSAQTAGWKLSARLLRSLSNMNARPTPFCRAR